jgi:hypothetical protein
MINYTRLITTVLTYVTTPKQNFARGTSCGWLAISYFLLFFVSAQTSVPRCGLPTSRICRRGSFGLVRRNRSLLARLSIHPTSRDRSGH